MANKIGPVIGSVILVLITSTGSPDWMSLRQAAEALGVHYMTAYRYVRVGLLPVAPAARASG